MIHPPVLSRLIRGLSPALLALAAATPARAAELAAIGADPDTFPRWKTASVAKAYDTYGNNIYGNDGYVLYFTESPSYSGSFKTGTNPLGNTKTLKAVPSYLLLENYYQDWCGLSAAYPNIDHPSGTGEVKSGLAGRSTTGSTFLMRITLQTGIPARGFRMGVMARNSGNDAPDDYIKVQKVGSEATVYAQYTAPVTGATGNTVYFFDFTNLAVGDQFQLLASNIGGKALYVGVTFDEIQPPPGTLILLH